MFYKFELAHEGDMFFVLIDFYVCDISMCHMS